MKEPEFKKPSRAVVLPKDFHIFFELLTNKGLEIIGPSIRDGAISYQHINSPGELPVGYMDRQDAGKYKLVIRERGDFFG